MMAMMKWHLVASCPPFVVQALSDIDIRELVLFAVVFPCLSAWRRELYTRMELAGVSRQPAGSCSRAHAGGGSSW